MIRSQLDNIVNKPKGRQLISTGLLTLLNIGGRCVNRVIQHTPDTVYYTYNTFSQVDLPTSMPLNDLLYQALCFIKDEGYTFSHYEMSMTITKGDFSWTVKHKHYYRLVIACAEIVFRIKYPFLPTRSDFLKRREYVAQKHIN